MQASSRLHQSSDTQFMMTELEIAGGGLLQRNSMNLLYMTDKEAIPLYSQQNLVHTYMYIYLSN